MSLVTPARRRAAIAEACEGIALGLGLPLDYRRGAMFPGRKPPVLEATTASDVKLMYDWTIPGSTVDIVNDDRVVLTLQYSTQWDGLSHVGAASWSTFAMRT